MVLADTVGFVRHLPHELVESFHATLQETLEADLLLHVIDSSSPDMHEQIDAVNAVLDEIGATAPVLLVHNKIDRTDELPVIHYQEQGVPHRVYVSARENLGTSELSQAVQELLVGTLSDFTLTLPHNAGQFKNTLHKLGVITHSEFDDTGHERLSIRLAKAKLKELLGKYQLNAFHVLAPHEAVQFLPSLEAFEKVGIKSDDDPDDGNGEDDELDPFCL